MSQKSLNKILKCYNDKEYEKFYKLSIKYIVKNKRLQDVNVFIVHLLQKSKNGVYFSFIKDLSKILKSNHSTDQIIVDLNLCKLKYIYDSCVKYILIDIINLNVSYSEENIDIFFRFYINQDSVYIDLISFCFPEYKEIIKLLYEK